MTLDTLTREYLEEYALNTPFPNAPTTYSYFAWEKVNTPSLTTSSVATGNQWADHIQVQYPTLRPRQLELVSPTGAIVIVHVFTDQDDTDLVGIVLHTPNPGNTAYVWNTLGTVRSVEDIPGANERDRLLNLYRGLNSDPFTLPLPKTPPS